MTRIVVMMYRMGCGGVERALIDLLRQIDADRYEVELLYLEKEGEFMDQVPDYVRQTELELSEMERILIKTTAIRPAVRHGFACGKWLQAMGLLFRYALHKLKRTPALAYAAAFDRFKPTEYDIALDFHGYASATTYFLAKKVKAKKRFTWVHGEGCTKDFPYIYQYLRKYDMILCVSKHLCEQVNRELPCYPRDQVAVFKNLIQYRDILNKAVTGPTLPMEKDSFCLLTVGRIAYEKGYDLLVDAAILLKQRGYAFRWYICGDGPLREHIEKRIAQNHLEATIILLGYCDNPYSLMRSCDLYVQTSISEGYGITIAEAALLGCVIVSTGVAGAMEEIVPGVNGAITDMNGKAIADAVAELFDDPRRLQAMRNRMVDYDNLNQDSLQMLNTILRV